MSTVDNINDNGNDPSSGTSDHVSNTAESASTTNATPSSPDAANSNDANATPASTTAAATINTDYATSATAAATANKNNDSHQMALEMHIVDQLTDIFSFPRHIAKMAVEHCDLSLPSAAHGDANGSDDGNHDGTTVKLEDVVGDYVQRCYNYILDNYSHAVQDKGGPVVPKLDCPHVARHVRFDANLNGLIKGENDWYATSDNESILNLECQHYGMLRRRMSRKRLRSEDHGKAVEGRLKCEDDYLPDSNDGIETDGSLGNAESNKVVVVDNAVQANDDDESSSSKGKMKTLCCPKGENWLCLECGVVLCSRYANGHAKMHWEDTREEDEAAEMGATGSAENDIEGDGAGHCIAVSLADLSVWCYVCSAYLQHPTLYALTKQLEDLKFGTSGSSNCGGSSENGEVEVVADIVAERLGEGEVRAESGTISECNDKKSNVGTNEGMDEDDEGNVEMKDAVEVGSVGANLDPNGLHTAVQSNSQIDDMDSDDEYGKDCEHDEHGSSSDRERDSEPRASLLSGQVGTTIRTYPVHDGQGSDANNNDDHSDSENESARSSDSEEYALHHAAISALVQREQAAAMRAYMNRHESFDPGDMSQCVPMISHHPRSQRSSAFIHNSTTSKSLHERGAMGQIDNRNHELHPFTVKLSFKGKSATISNITHETTSGDLLALARAELQVGEDVIIKLLYKGKIVGQDLLEDSSNSNEIDLFNQVAFAKQAVTIPKNGVVKVVVIGTEAQGVRKLNSGRSDPTIRGFDDVRSTASDKSGQSITQLSSYWGPTHGKQHPQYKFCRFQECTDASFGSRPGASTPHAFEARRLLEQLATDPGIVSILQSRELVVGTLGEMDPIDDRLMQKKQQEGACLLGYNTNHGMRIDVKLRTDDLSGFRPYNELAATLIHEISHNWVGEHNVLFWTNYGQMRVEYLWKHACLMLGGEFASGKRTAALAGVINMILSPNGSGNVGAAIQGGRSKASSILNRSEIIENITQSVLKELAKEMAQHRIPVQMVAPAVTDFSKDLIVESEADVLSGGQRLGTAASGEILAGASARERALAAAEKRARETKKNSGESS